MAAAHIPASFISLHKAASISPFTTKNFKFKDGLTSTTYK